jgi:hypothetical protein
MLILTILRVFMTIHRNLLIRTNPPDPALGVIESVLLLSLLVVVSTGPPERFSLSTLISTSSTVNISCTVSHPSSVIVTKAGLGSASQAMVGMKSYPLWGQSRVTRMNHFDDFIFQIVS